MCKDILKTTAKAVQQALLGWTVPISTGRRGKMIHRHSLQPLFWICKTEKTSFPQHDMIKKRTPWNCHEKEPKKRLKCAETSRLIHFVSQRLFTNVNASTRGFQSGGIFLM
jgi:hypothetical protein